MDQLNLPVGKWAAAVRARIAAIGIAWLALVTIPAACVTAQSSPSADQDDQMVERWRPTLERYIRKLEGEHFRGDFVIERYLGQLDWLGDSYEEVPAGRYFGFSVRFSTRNDLLVEVTTTRAVLFDSSGKILGDIEYPNTQLVWPGTHQPYLFGIPALRSTDWRAIAGRSKVWWCSGP